MSSASRKTAKCGSPAAYSCRSPKATSSAIAATEIVDPADEAVTVTVAVEEAHDRTTAVATEIVGASGALVAPVDHQTRLTDGY